MQTIELINSQKLFKIEFLEFNKNKYRSHSKELVNIVIFKFSKVI